MSDRPPPIERPNGKLYRPFKVVAHAWENDDGQGSGAVVLGTQDIERARALATEAVQLWFDGDFVAVHPIVGWFRLGWNYGELTWIRDPVRGRAGVQFDADYPEGDDE